MKLEALHQSINDDAKAGANPCEYLLWIAPNGLPIECPAGFDMTDAVNAAGKLAITQPRRVVGIYCLVGVTEAPFPTPRFTARDVDVDVRLNHLRCGSEDLPQPPGAEPLSEVLQRIRAINAFADTTVADMDFLRNGPPEPPEAA